MLVVLFATPLWFANSVHFREEVDRAIAHAGSKPQVLVLDTLGLYDIDYTGTLALGHLLDRCAQEHITVGIARAGDRLRQSLERSGLMARIGTDHSFETVNAAVEGLSAHGAPQAQPPPGS